MTCAVKLRYRKRCGGTDTYTSALLLTSHLTHAAPSPPSEARPFGQAVHLYSAVVRGEGYAMMGETDRWLRARIKNRMYYEAAYLKPSIDGSWPA